jgi:hypothetical protein
MNFDPPKIRVSLLALRHRTPFQQQGQAALEAVLLTLLLALAVFSLVDDSPLARLVFSLHDHHARMARGLALP